MIASALAPVLYLACIFGIVLYVIKLITQFVQAQERLAGAMEMIAHKMRDDSER